MIELNIPGRGINKIHHLVCDVNGTLAVDGKLINGISRTLVNLKDRVTIHMITADTHGKQKVIDHILGLEAVRLKPGNEAEQKADFVRQLGADTVIATGQGANDALMLKTAGIGICILSEEGTAIECLNAADLLVPDIFSAMALLEKPLRLVASLRR